MSLVDTTETDENLLVRSGNGDQLAFRQLYERYKKALWGYLRGCLKNDRQAEDLMQETFVKVYKGADTFDQGKKFKPWFWQIARNTLIDYWRGKDELVLIEGEFLESFESGEDLVLDQMIAKEDKIKIEKVLGLLSKPQREALLLRTQGELSYEEMAKELGITVTSVKTLLFRAKKVLTNALGGGSHDS